MNQAVPIGGTSTTVMVANSMTTMVIITLLASVVMITSQGITEVDSKATTIKEMMLYMMVSMPTMVEVTKLIDGKCNLVLNVLPAFSYTLLITSLSSQGLFVIKTYFGGSPNVTELATSFKLEAFFNELFKSLDCETFQ